MLSDDFYAGQLNSDALAIYDYFLAEFASMRISGTYRFDTRLLGPDPRLKDGIQAMKALSRDHPEFFFISPSYQISQQGPYFVFDDLTAYTAEQVKQIAGRLEQELLLLTNDVMEFDEWERERLIYERIAVRYQYKKHDRFDDRNVVGLLLRGEGVCSAYADMLVLALRKSGIACHRVSGGGHGWAMVYLGGFPLHCDVAWEAHEGGDSLSYTYFNITSEEVFRDHVLPEYAIPESRFKGYGFHRKNGCCFSTTEEAVEYIRKALLRGDRVIRLKTDCTEPIDAIVKKSIRQMPFGNYRYSVNEMQGTAIILKE